MDIKIAKEMKRIMVQEIMRNEVEIKINFNFLKFQKLKQRFLNDLKKQGKTQAEIGKIYDIVLAAVAKFVATRAEKEILKKLKTI